MPVEMGLWRVDDKPVRLLPETGTVAITRNRPSSAAHQIARWYEDHKDEGDQNGE